MTFDTDDKTLAPGGFDYSLLDEKAAEHVRGVAVHVNRVWDNIFEQWLEVGRLLLDAKETIGGHYAEWVKAECPFSLDTAYNATNTAKRLQHVPQALHARFDAKALRILGRSTTSPEAVEGAITLADSGQNVGQQAAYILANSPEGIRKRYLNGDFGKSQVDRVYEGAKRLKEVASEVVRQFCLVHDVWRADFIDQLVYWYGQCVDAPDDMRRFTIWHDLVQSAGWLAWDGGEERIHIRDADDGHMRIYMRWHSELDLRRKLQMKHDEIYGSDNPRREKKTITNTSLTVTGEVELVLQDDWWCMRFTNEDDEPPAYASGQTVFIRFDIEKEVDDEIT